MKYPDLSSAAAALYDGGWRSSDYEDLVVVYSMTDEEAKEICEELKKMEESKNEF